MYKNKPLYQIYFKSNLFFQLLIPCLSILAKEVKSSAIFIVCYCINTKRKVHESYIAIFVLPSMGCIEMHVTHR